MTGPDGSAGPAAPRRAARERALALLYEAEAKGALLTDLLSELATLPDRFTVEIVEGVARDRERIDALLAAHAIGWAPGRMPPVDLAIARIAVYELMEEAGVPVAVVLSEAVELAQKFSTESSGRFLNGVLAAVASAIVRTEP